MCAIHKQPNEHNPQVKQIYKFPTQPKVGMTQIHIHERTRTISHSYIPSSAYSRQCRANMHTQSNHSSLLTPSRQECVGILSHWIRTEQQCDDNSSRYIGAFPFARISLRRQRRRRRPHRLNTTGYMGHSVERESRFYSVCWLRTRRSLRRMYYVTHAHRWLTFNRFSIGFIRWKPVRYNRLNGLIRFRSRKSCNIVVMHVENIHVEMGIASLHSSVRRIISYLSTTTSTTPRVELWD